MRCRAPRGMKNGTRSDESALMTAHCSLMTVFSGQFPMYLITPRGMKNPQFLIRFYPLHQRHPGRPLGPIFQGRAV